MKEHGRLYFKVRVCHTIRSNLEDAFENFVLPEFADPVALIFRFFVFSCFQARRFQAKRAQ